MMTTAGFSASKRKEILEGIQGTIFDLVVIGCGIREALTTLYAAASGLRVALFCEEDFHQNLYPLTSSGRKGKESREVEKLLALFRENAAHLVLPDEFLWLRESLGLKENLLRLFDKDQERIALAEVSHYEPLLNVTELNAVVLDREYKLDASRLLMAILKQAVEQGAVVLNYVSAKPGPDENIWITDQLKDQEVEVFAPKVREFESARQDGSVKELHLYLSNRKFNLKRSLKIEWEGLMVRLVRRQDFFHVIVRGGEEQDKSKKVIALLNRMIKDVEPLTDEDVLRRSEKEHHSNNELGNCLVEVQQFLKEECGIASSRFQELIAGTLLSGANFEGKTAIHELIQYGDQRCDEAKQTGILALDFKPIFYRYGTDIEWLTEEAYQLCRQIADPLLLWRYVEVKYMIEKEMLCRKEDLFQRIGSHLLTDEEWTELDRLGRRLF